MACEEYQDQIYLLQRGELEPGAAAGLRAHLEACTPCRTTYDREEALTAALAGASRHAAPAGLRQRVAETLRAAAAGAEGRSARSPRRWAPRVWRPLVPAALGAAVAALISVPATWYLAGRPPAPIVVLAQEVAQEHERVGYTLEWDRGRQDLAVTLAYLSRWLDVEFPKPPLLAGALKLVGARPTYIFERKAAAFTYEDERGRRVTLFVFRGGDIQLPEKGRVQVERFRPYFAAADGNALCVWRQKEAGFSMVGRMTQEEMAEAFLRVRRGL